MCPPAPYATPPLSSTNPSSHFLTPNKPKRKSASKKQIKRKKKHFFPSPPPPPSLPPPASAHTRRRQTKRARFASPRGNGLQAARAQRRVQDAASATARARKEGEERSARRDWDPRPPRSAPKPDLPRGSRPRREIVGRLAGAAGGVGLRLAGGAGERRRRQRRNAGGWRGVLSCFFFVFFFLRVCEL